ncbi:hypothetical protein [Streptococcus sp. DD11]|uniref:hypothetical protein n=1 Tax=Streptococcus sp. DD11 TaxID=1777879 RepID=UPI000A9A8356|nr:hypothetical protein [Streptococcus sp. DD11]
MSEKDGQGQVQGGWQEHETSQPLQGNFQQIQPQGLPDKKGNIGTVIGGSVFALIIGLLIGSGSAYLIGKQAQTDKDIQRIKRLTKAQEEAKEKDKGFITDGQSVQFTWTLKDLGLLSYTNDDGLGLTADQIVAAYGLASSAEYDGNQLILRWASSVRDKEQNIYFQFDEVDQNYYLRQVTVGDSFKEYRKEKETTDWSELSQEDLERLQTGDKETGKGGTALSEVLQKHPVPSEIVITTERDVDNRIVSNRLMAAATYKTEDGYQHLVFLGQRDGSFLYIGADEE